MKYLIIATLLMGCSSLYTNADAVRCERKLDEKRNKIKAMSIENDAKIDSLMLIVEEKQCQIDSIRARLKEQK